MGLPYWTAPAQIDTKEATKADVTASQRSPIRRSRPSPSAHPSTRRAATTNDTSGTRTRPPQTARRSGALEPLSAYSLPGEDGYSRRSRRTPGYVIPPPPRPLPAPVSGSRDNDLAFPQFPTSGSHWLHDSDTESRRRFTRSPMADAELHRLPPLRRMSHRNIADGPLSPPSRHELWGRIEPNSMTGGLGNRNRSPSMHGDEADTWDTMLSTITPDTQLPSFDSSFTSAAASASASFSANRSNENSQSNSATNSETRSSSASASSSRTHLTIPSPILNPRLTTAGNACPSDTESTNDSGSDTEADTDEVTIRLSRTHHPRSPPPRRTSGIRETLRNRPWRGPRSSSSNDTASVERNQNNTRELDEALETGRVPQRYFELYENRRAHIVREIRRVRERERNSSSPGRSYLDYQERVLQRNRDAMRHPSRGHSPERILSLREHLLMEHYRSERERSEREARVEQEMQDVDRELDALRRSADSPAPDRIFDFGGPDIMEENDSGRGETAAQADADADSADVANFVRRYESFMQAHNPRALENGNHGDNIRGMIEETIRTSHRMQREADGIMHGENNLSSESDDEVRLPNTLEGMRAAVEDTIRTSARLAREAEQALRGENLDDPFPELEQLTREIERDAETRAERRRQEQEQEQDQEQDQDQDERERQDPTLPQSSMLGIDPELETMRAILERMSRRDDIPEWWWESAGLSPAIARGRL